MGIGDAHMNTETVLLILTGLLLLWDAYLWFDGKPGNTISQVIIKFSHDYPLIPLGFGFLLGHFYG